MNILTAKISYIMETFRNKIQKHIKGMLYFIRHLILKGK